MSAEVIHLPVKPKFKPDQKPQFYCTNCDGDDFKILACGVVSCARCGSLMRNLEVRTK